MEMGELGGKDGKGVKEVFTLALSGRGALRLEDGQEDTWHCPWGQHERELVHNPHGDGRKEPGSLWSHPVLIEAKRKRKRERGKNMWKSREVKDADFWCLQPGSGSTLSLPPKSCVTLAHK